MLPMECQSNWNEKCLGVAFIENQYFHAFKLNGGKERNFDKLPMLLLSMNIL